MKSKMLQILAVTFGLWITISCGKTPSKLTPATPPPTEVVGTAKFGGNLLPASDFNTEIQGENYSNFGNCLQLAVYSDGTQQVWLFNASCPVTATLLGENQISIRLYRDPVSGILTSKSGTVAGQTDTNSPPQTVTELCKPFTSICTVNIDAAGLFAGTTPTSF
jgi:hypothetical protein